MTLTKDDNGKTVTKVVDDDERTPLTEDYEQGMAWVNDSKKWDEVYTVKPYDYMAIVVDGGTPVYDKDQGKYVDLAKKQEEDKEAAEKELKENLMEHTKDFSEFAKPVNTTDEMIIDGEDLPF